MDLAFDKQFEITEYGTLLADDIPIVADYYNYYNIEWKADGYRPVDPVQIGVRRNPTNPYLVDFSPDPPGNVAVMVTDRWGTLQGTISKADGGGGALSGATIRLGGQNLSIQTSTDVNGSYNPTIEPDLGQLIPRRLPDPHQPCRLCQDHRYAHHQ